MTAILIIDWIFPAVASLSYEKVCVLYNIAALQSQVAAGQSGDSDEALKKSTKLFQVCDLTNWIFVYTVEFLSLQSTLCRLFFTTNQVSFANFDFSWLARHNILVLLSFPPGEPQSKLTFSF